MENIVKNLTEMGFSRDKAELAATKCSSTNLETVMDWLISHEDELEAMSSASPVHTQTNSIPNDDHNVEQQVPENHAAELHAKSIICNDCGKLFSNNNQVEVHAVKTGHDNFAESTEEKKPLTENEKKEQLAKIEAKLRQRRLDREFKEKQEELEREKNRIKSGKEMLEAKKKYEELEMKKILDSRKREKEEERLARQRVKEKIEQDKLARKAKFSTQNDETINLVAPPVQVSKPVTNYSNVRLQIRLTNGNSLTQTFSAKEPLSAVRLYIEMNRNDAQQPFNLMTNFPKKVFSTDDYEKPLDVLGLAPSAVLIVSNAL